MIAADTSTWIAYLQGESGRDVEMLDEALASGRVLMPPAVLAEVLSDFGLSEETVETLLEVRQTEIDGDYWRRAGLLRARVLKQRRKARLGDALIAQSCIDANVALITRDRDFRAFAEAAGLQLIA